jgi:hypothetical protein
VFRLTSPIARLLRPFGSRQVERLLWAGRHSGRRRVTAQFLVRAGTPPGGRGADPPDGAATLTGAEPTDGDGNPLAPEDAYGHDHLWWLDRMVRTNQPLVERMTLVWHDWFSTSNDGVASRA